VGETGVSRRPWETLVVLLWARESPAQGGGKESWEELEAQRQEGEGRAVVRFLQELGFDTLLVMGYRAVIMAAPRWPVGIIVAASLAHGLCHYDVRVGGGANAVLSVKGLVECSSGGAEEAVAGAVRGQVLGIARIEPVQERVERGRHEDEQARQSGSPEQHVSKRRGFRSNGKVERIAEPFRGGIRIEEGPGNKEGRVARQSYAFRRTSTHTKGRDA
jgi:hypothetical protein